jgi:lipopolysaccharide O-acetyltransferase
MVPTIRLILFSDAIYFGLWESGMKILSRYGVIGSLRLLKNLILTRTFYPDSRLIRFPIFVRGRRNIHLGKGLTTGVHVRLDAFTASSDRILVIGDNVQLNDSVHIAAIECVEIGESTLIASRVFISDHNHGRYDVADSSSGPSVPPLDRPLVSRPVKIGRNVWIGEQVCILPGVIIGDGAIVGANSVVTKNIAEYSIVVGNPAKVIRVFDPASCEWKRV